MKLDLSRLFLNFLKIFYELFILTEKKGVKMTPEMSNILKEGFAKFKARTGLSNNEIADRLHCSASSVSLYCQGKTSITYETATILLQMGMKISELFGDEIAAKNFPETVQTDDSAKLVYEGLQKLLKFVNFKNQDETQTKPNGF